jgi:hypothetical protein
MAAPLSAAEPFDSEVPNQQQRFCKQCCAGEALLLLLLLLRWMHQL